MGRAYPRMSLLCVAWQGRCNFDDSTVDTVVNQRIRDQFLVGMKSAEIRRQLLVESKLTLAAAVEKAVSLETSYADASLYDSPVAAAAMVNRIVPEGNKTPRVGNLSGAVCKYCGQRHKPGKKNCPAGNAVCRACGKTGHFQRVCLSKKRSEQDQVFAADQVAESSEVMEQNVVYDTAFASFPTSPNSSFMTTLSINGMQVQDLIDTGASRSILKEEHAVPTRPSDRVLRAYSGDGIQTLEMADVTAEYGERSTTCSCFIVKRGNTALFGQDLIRALQLVAVTPDTVNALDTTIVDIAVDPSATPVALPPRRPAFSTRDEVEEELKRLRTADIIEPVREATPWVAPLVPARKDNGKLRLCVDYRQLNKHVIRERRAIPTVDEILSTLKGATHFSVLDAESGFHQTRLSDQSRGYTTFSSHCGTYRFKRLPFGIASAPEIFQRVISDLLEGLSGVVVYIDDILVYGASEEEHRNRLNAVLRRVNDHGLRLNWKKCQISQKEVHYLGHVISGGGIRPDPAKTAAIMHLPPPATLADVRRLWAC